MRMGMLAILGALMLLIQGCSSNITKEELAYAQAQLERPTFKMSCPESGCNFSEFEYYDPSVQVAMPTNGYDVANKAMGTLSSVLLGVAPFYFLNEGMQALANTGNSTTNTSTVNTTTDQSSVAYDGFNTDTRSYTDSFNSTTSTTDTWSNTLDYQWLGDPAVTE